MFAYITHMVMHILLFIIVIHLPDDIHKSSLT